MNRVPAEVPIDIDEGGVVVRVYRLGDVGTNETEDGVYLVPAVRLLGMPADIYQLHEVGEPSSLFRGLEQALKPVHKRNGCKHVL